MQIKEMLSGFKNLFFPPECAGCGRVLIDKEHDICIDCLLELPKSDFHTVDVNPVFEKLKGRFPINKATSFLLFSKFGLVQELIHHLKYQGRKEIGLILGRLFAEDLKQINWAEGIDALLPVAIHKKKQRIRGYNQAYFIAKGISEILNIPVLPADALIKLKHTDSQTRKGKVARIENVHSVFKLQNPEVIAHKHILLIDDVLTTGATIEAIALEILKANPKGVSVATLACAM